MTQEKTIRPISGWGALALCLTLLIVGVPAWGLLLTLVEGNVPLTVVSVLAMAATGLSGFVGLFGLVAIAPNEARVFLLFGEYIGTAKESGFFWVNPFYSKKHISLRVRNFETGSKNVPATHDAAGKIVEKQSRTHGRPAKVNDRDGNPIDISAVVVWKVVNTAEALFEVDDYEDFVGVQTDAAIRSLASRYPYDSEDHETSLRGSPDIICDQLRKDIQDRLHKAGVEVIEARLSHLAYSAEIAAAMLQRQQAHAVVAARTKIVEGAVGMVEMALEQLAAGKMVHLDDERRAQMVSNLLVVLCSDRHTQPVINTGTN
ncbi:MAG: SPFH domain-containing protein [Pirellulaceae bacterium]|nr:SPFH domain-containing protein [Pirellulaceae bacterium]